MSDWVRDIYMGERTEWQVWTNIDDPGPWRRHRSQRIHLFPQPRWVYLDTWPLNMRRVSGDALCRRCLHPYREHPNHPDFDIPTLHVACDGRPVKT